MDFSKYILLLFAIFVIGCSDVNHKVHSNFPTLNKDSIKTSHSKVAVIVPLTGKHMKVGQSILNSCMLAIKDYDNLEMLVFDSEVAKRNFAEAANILKTKNVKFVVGPVFGNEATELFKLTYGIQYFTLSNNPKISSPGVIIFGINAEEETKVLFEYAIEAEKKKILALIPKGEYGNLISKAIDNTSLNGAYVRKVRYNKLSNDIIHQQINEVDFDAIFFSEPFQIPNTISDNILILCPYSFKENNTSHNNSVIALPDQTNREKFEDFYKSEFSLRPDDVSIIGYDIASTVFSAAKKNRTPSQVLNHSYRGVLGEFYIDKNGKVSRDWQIYRKQ